MGYSIIIPREVDRICSFSFAGAVDLKSVRIPKNVSYIAGDAFRDCRQLAAIHCEFGTESIPGAPWGAPETCKVYFNCFYEDNSNQEEQPQPGGIDTSDATATAADILYPKTAYSKGRKLTGNVPTITPYMDGNTVIIPEGYNPQDKEFTFDVPSGTDTSDATVTADKLLDGVTAYGADGKVTGNIKTVTASLSGNVATVPAGYIAQKQTLIVPVADEPEVSANVVTVNPGYVASKKTVTVAEAGELSVTDNVVTVPVGYIKSARTATVPVADAPTTSGNVVTVNKGYQAEQKKVTVGTAQGAKTYTPGTSDQTIAAGTYISGTQTIIGDANLNESNIAAGKKIFGKTGVFTADATAEAEDIAEGATAYVNGKKITGTAKASTGGGSFAKVTAFSPAVDAYTAATSIQVSGFGEVDGEDFSAWNGTYVCTNPHETTTEARIYKHETDTKYLYYAEDEEYGDYFWGFHTSIRDLVGRYSAQFFSDTLASGSWENYDMGFSVTITIVKNDVEYPAQELVLNAVKATFENGGWTSGSAVTLTGYEKEPIADGIYMVDGTQLIGDALAFDFVKWMPTNGLLCYFPMTDTGKHVVDRVNGIRLAKFGKLFSDGYSVANSGKGVVIGTQRAFTLPTKFTLSAKINCTDRGAGGGNVIDFGTCNTGGFGIRASSNNDSNTVSYGLRINADENIRKITVNRGEEHVITFTFDGIDNDSENMCHCYKDGVEVDSLYYGAIPEDQPSVEMFCRFIEAEENGSFWEVFPGTIADVMLWNRVLSDAEIASIANK